MEDEKKKEETGINVTWTLIGLVFASMATVCWVLDLACLVRKGDNSMGLVFLVFAIFFGILCWVNCFALANLIKKQKAEIDRQTKEIHRLEQLIMCSDLK